MNTKIFLLFSVFVLVSFGFVSADTTLVSPVTGGNYSTVTFNCTTALAEALNYTIYYNESGSSTTAILFISGNDTSSDTEFYNASYSLSGFPNLATYNFTCMVWNGTEAENSTQIIGITIDNTPPSASFIGLSFIAWGNYSGTSTIINISSNDSLIGMSTVYLNVTNSIGVQRGFIKTDCSGGYCNYSADTAAFTLAFGDGIYNFTIYANDTLGNLNNTEIITVTLDNTNPVLSLSLVNSFSTSLSLILSVSDALSGVNSACTVDRTNAVVTATDLSNQLLDESELSCGNSYTYIVTCVDSAGNSGSKTESFSTTGCSSVVGGGSSSTSSTWTKTLVVKEEDFQKGFNTQLNKNQRLKVQINSESHHVGIKKIESDKVTIEIASEPIEVILGVGEESKRDLNEDGFYDLYVKLNSIEGIKADLTIKKINEEVPEEEKDSTTSPLENLSGFTKSNSWIYVVVGLIIIIIVVIVFSKRKK
jgi:hypothetical protein